MANYHAVYIDSPSSWTYAPDSYDSKLGFYTNAWLTNQTEEESETPVISCSYFYEIGKEDDVGFTPRRINYNSGNGILTVEGKQAGVPSLVSKSFRKKSPSPRFLNLRESLRKRRPARFMVSEIITDDNDGLMNIKKYLGIDQEDEEMGAEEFEAEQVQFDVLKGKPSEGGSDYGEYISIHDSYEEAQEVAKMISKNLADDEEVYIIEEVFDDETFDSISSTKLMKIGKSPIIEASTDRYMSAEEFGSEMKGSVEYDRGKKSTQYNLQEIVQDYVVKLDDEGIVLSEYNLQELEEAKEQIKENIQEEIEQNPQEYEDGGDIDDIYSYTEVEFIDGSKRDIGITEGKVESPKSITSFDFYESKIEYEKPDDYYFAEEFEADSFQDDTHIVLIHGEKDGETVSKGHQLGITEKDGFTPTTITTFDYSPKAGLGTSGLLNFDERVETIDPNFVNRHHISQRFRGEEFEADTADVDFDEAYMERQDAERIMKLLRIVKRKATGSNARYAKTYADAAEMAYYDYGFKGLKTQVAYVLSNLGGWRGDEAKQVKAELRKLMK